MRLSFAALLASIALCAAAPAVAEADALGVDLQGRQGAELPPYLECVPYARAQSGIQIFGDAWTWWDKADGHYQRGNRPQKGAVLAFQPSGNMRLGHVAAVSRVVDSRTVLLSHANWSPIDGRRGQIERDVRAVDVSPANDWSQVRVWYAPLGDLGTTAWPAHGFIYPKAAPRTQVAAAPRIAAAPVTAPARMQLAAVQPVTAPAATRAPTRTVPPPAPAARDSFAAAFAGFSAPAAAPVTASVRARPVAAAAPQMATAAPEDIVGDIIQRSRR